jgi:hypothetical protein
LRKLRRYIGRDLALFVGGRAVADFMHLLEELNAKYISDIDQLCQELNACISQKNQRPTAKLGV